MKNIRILVLATALMVSAAPAYAADVTALGGATFTNYSFDPTASVDTGVSFAVGALVGHDFAPGLGVEVGALYMGRKIGTTTLGVTTSVTNNYLDIPVLFRVTLIPILLLEAGGYVDPGLSSTGTVGGFGATGSAPKVDFGLRGVVGVRFPLLPRIALRAQAQYSLGLINAVDSSVVTAKTRAIDVLGGLTIEI